jgi:hypothetical protein
LQSHLLAQPYMQDHKIYVPLLSEALEGYMCEVALETAALRTFVRIKLRGYMKKKLICMVILYTT